MSNAVTSTGILVKRKAITETGPVAVDLTGVAIGNPAVVTSDDPHGFTSGDEVVIAGVTGSTPSVAGTRVVTVIDPTHFSIPVNVTVAGTGGTATQDYITVAEITEVTPGGMSRNKIETSTHNDGTESFVLGILRQSDPGLKVNYVGSEPTHVVVLDDIKLNRKARWRFAYPSGVSRTGDAFVQQFMFDGAPVDSKQGATLALAWAGPVTELAEAA